MISKGVAENGHRISLARVPPVHGTRDAFEKGDPGINRLDKIAKQHDRLEFTREMESQCENGEGHLQSPWQENLDRGHCQENHASQTKTQIVKDFNGRFTLLLQTLKNNVLDFHVSGLYLPKRPSATQRI